MSGTLWLGKRKRLFALRADARRRSWRLASPQFLDTVHVICALSGG